MKSMRMFSGIFFLFLLSACDYKPASPESDSGKVSVKLKNDAGIKTDYSTHVTALPLIMNTIRIMAPEFKDGFDISSIRDVCMLARGETTKADVRKRLLSRGIKPELVPSSGNALSILLNDDDDGRKTLCAAYIASKVDSPLDKTQFIEKVKISKPGSKETKYEDKIIPARLSDMLATKLASSRANAEVFALIGTLLQQKKGLTSEEYFIETKRIFSKISPYYLRRVQELFTPDLSGYILTSASKNGDYSFITTGGYAFSRSETSYLLKYRDVNWLGKGNIQGYKYYIDVRDIPRDVIEIFNHDHEGKEKTEL